MLLISVIPAKAGIAGGSYAAPSPEAPAFAGATMCCEAAA
jgi:hypothetical protein